VKIVLERSQNEILAEETSTNDLNLATTVGCMKCYVSKDRVRIPNPGSYWGTLIFIPDLNPIQLKRTRGACNEHTHYHSSDDSHSCKESVKIE